jgi:hypothetical protein
VTSRRDRGARVEASERRPACVRVLDGKGRRRDHAITLERLRARLAPGVSCLCLRDDADRSRRSTSARAARSQRNFPSRVRDPERIDSRYAGPADLELVGSSRAAETECCAAVDRQGDLAKVVLGTGAIVGGTRAEEQLLGGFGARLRRGTIRSRVDRLETGGGFPTRLRKEVGRVGHGAAMGCCRRTRFACV